MTYLEKHSFTGPIFDPPKFMPTIIVCIPVLNEPNLLETIRSLAQAKAQYDDNVLVMVLFNHNESAIDTIKQANQVDFLDFAKAVEEYQSEGFQVVAHLKELLKKHAGVGLARKILMDEGVRLFALSEKEDGLLAAMDGDSTVAPNYFEAIHDFFQKYPNLEAASIHFEHPFPKNELEWKAIIQYELHLRYFVEAQKMAGLPTAFQTIGSSMAVRQNAYQLQGGMNKRKAGEDFYFLQKFARKGTLGNLASTIVFPSSRISDRVPFGTGRAMGKLLTDEPELTSHALIIFDQIKCLFDGIPTIWDKQLPELLLFLTTLPLAVQDFLSENDFLGKVLETQRNTASQAAFLKRFYSWFDAFLMMKYVHFARDNYYPDESIVDVAHQFAIREWLYKGEKKDLEKLLKAYRKSNLIN